MKNKLLNILLGACLLLSTACSDQFLEDKRDYDRFPPEDIFSDANQANAVFGSLYLRILSRYNSPLAGSDALMRQGQSISNVGSHHMLTEEIASGYTGINIVGDGNFQAAHTKSQIAGNHTGNPHYWNYGKNSTSYNSFSQWILFPTIFRINNFLGEIDRYRDQYMADEPEFWDNLKGQAIFARAWLHFDAIRFFGGIPYYSTSMEDMPKEDDRSPRMSVQECIDKIAADFDEAASLLPAKWNSENRGRFTSVAALAMKSRVLLYAASPVFNASWDNTGGQRWQAALEAGLAAEQAANNAGYGSSVNSIDTWDQMFYNTGIADNEAIILIPKNSNNIYSSSYSNKWEGYIRPHAVNSASGAGIPAPKQMIDLFPMKDGSRPAEGINYDPIKFYRDRDPRFYRTFAFSGCEWPGTTKQIWLYAYKYGSQYRYTDGTQGDAGAQKKSKAIVWKMSDPSVGVGGEDFAGTDILEYRYAEILLNIAECYAAQGNAGKCIEYLSKVRQRVGISAANNYGLGNLGDKYALIEACLYERRVELAYEGKRSWDMRRWLLYEGGAGFDPVAAGVDGKNHYDPDVAWGLGWKLYNGQNGKPLYTKSHNTLTMLGLERFSGTKHIGEIWGYDLSVEQLSQDDPLANNTDRMAVPAIKKSMSDAERDAAFDKLETFYVNNDFVTVNPINTMGPQYGMDSGSSDSDKNFLFSWRGWYYVKPLHYDLYDADKGNTWITQTEGWMIANANNGAQDGTYIYCTPE